VTSRSFRALYYFLVPHPVFLGWLIIVLLASAALESLTAAAVFPVVAAMLGEGVQGQAGWVIHFLGQVTNMIPIADPVSAAVVLLVVLVMFKGGMVFLRETMIAGGSARIVRDAKMELLSSFVHAPYSYFVMPQKSNLHHLITMGPKGLGDALVLLPYAVAQFLTGFAIVLLLLSLNWKLTMMVAVVGLLVYAIFGSVSQWVSHAIGKQQTHVEAEEHRVAREFLQGIREILIARAGLFWAARFGKESDRYRSLATKDGILQSIPRVLIEICFFAAVGALVLIYRWQAAGSAEGFAPVMAVFAYAVYRLVGAMGLVLGYNAKLNNKLPVVEELFDAIRTIPRRSEEGRSDIVVRKMIEFDHVWFGYPGQEQPALRDLCFDIPAGKLTGIIGPNGSGKSTVLHLLLGLFEPMQGRILVDGMDLKAVHPESWLCSTGFIGAGSFLFSGTVEENIRFGLVTPTMEEVRGAARMAQAHEFISQLPQGYDTMLGEKGIGLSDGQRHGPCCDGRLY
jgi:ABC-type multidrug transport system fused ATPase/permease subunit